MNHKMIARVLGMVLLCLAGLMLLPLITALYYGESPAPFAISALFTAALGYCMTRCKPARDSLYAREGFITVGLSWMLMSLLGALPYILSGDIPNFIDALFESASGFTTTGPPSLRILNA